MREPTKSFTGCWTCRERKIKCDLIRPACGECTQDNLVCGGYDVRLTWPDEGKSELRRRIDFVTFPKRMLYETYEDLDTALNVLSGTNVEDTSDTVVSGPFSVFQSLNIGSKSVTPKQDSEASHVSSQSDVRFLEIEDVLPLESKVWRTADEILLAGENIFAIPDDYTADIQPDVYARSLLFDSINSSSYDGQDTHLSGKTYEECSYFTPLGRFLLSNYRSNVAPNMSIIVHPQNVWYIFFIPRVLAAVGDIVSTGSTTYARYCILYAISAISAFHLAQNFPDKGEPSHDYYRNIGHKFHDASKSMLSQCVKGQNVGKYKDFLAALLCMTNVEFITGSGTRGNDVPLRTMKKLIKSRLINRPKTSRKAALLHKVCAMSILLTNAAGSWPDSSDKAHSDDDDVWIDTVFADMAPIQTEAETRRLEYLQRLQSRQRALSYMESTSELDEYFLQYTANSAHFQEAFSMELMHGIPDLLAFLFKETVTISRAALWERQRPAQASAGYETNSFSDKLSLKCTILEGALQNWQAQFRPLSVDELPKGSQNTDADGNESRVEIINHHTLAFYEALVIYHYRVAKGVNRELLQSYVVHVIEHLEGVSYQNMKSGRVLAIPCLFPGFVGACEVSESDHALIRRYDRWFHDMDHYGLASYTQTMNIIAEIRRRRRSGEDCDWWTLARENGVTIDLH